MGVSTLIGEADGTTRAGAMYDSTSGWMLGPVWEAEDPGEQIDAFLEWLRTLAFMRLVDEIGLRTSELPFVGRDGSDPREWPDGGLKKLVAYWRRENVNEDGWLKT